MVGVRAGVWMSMRMQMRLCMRVCVRVSVEQVRRQAVAQREELRARGARRERLVLQRLETQRYTTSPLDNI